MGFFYWVTSGFSLWEEIRCFFKSCATFINLSYAYWFFFILLFIFPLLSIGLCFTVLIFGLSPCSPDLQQSTNVQNMQMTTEAHPHTTDTLNPPKQSRAGDRIKTAIRDMANCWRKKQTSLANSKKPNKHIQRQPIEEANAPSMMRKEKSD